MEKVVAVTVTYNSSDFLRRCVKGLMQQSHSIMKIIIVDNHSDIAHKSINENLIQNSIIDYCYLEENSGGAGGFEFGMKRALKYAPDWIWIMDDDAFPDSECLDKLLQHKDYPNLGCICPAIYGVENQAFQVYHHKRISKFFLTDKPKYKSYEKFPDVFEIDANAFVGPLISTTVINDIGVANGALFIYGDDTEYTYRLTRKYKMIVVKNAIIRHRDFITNDSNKINPNGWWKTYYMFRNRFLFAKEFSKNRLHYLILTLYWRMQICNRIINACINPKFKRYRKIRISILQRAIKDGINGRAGKLLDPNEYLYLLNKIIS